MLGIVRHRSACTQMDARALVISSRSISQPATEQCNPCNKERGCNCCTLDLGFLIDLPKQKERHDDRQMGNSVHCCIQEPFILAAIAR